MIEMLTRDELLTRIGRKEVHLDSICLTQLVFQEMKEFNSSLIITNWTEVATIDVFNLKARDDDTQLWMQKLALD